MDCTHCGWDSGIGSYTMRFSPSGRQPRTLDLRLCEVCAGDLLADPEVELVSPAIFVPT
ncbi:MAG: hypothetical protein ABEJ06_04140 [Haloarculaceae archaeon]